MSSDSGIGAPAAAPWYRVVAIPDTPYGGTAERDYASVLPAVLDAAKNRRPFVVGWFSRGGGAPLELLTNAGPLPPPPTKPLDADADASTSTPEPQAGDRQSELTFPWGARGVPFSDGLMTDLGRLIWAPCPGRQGPPLAAEPSGQPGGGADSWLGSSAGLGAGLGGSPEPESPPPCSSPRSPR